MNLLIISNMAHYLRDGVVVGWGPTAQEIGHLAGLFREVRHVGCLHDVPAPPSALPYPSDRVRLIPLPPSGGPTWRHKLGILRRIPLYLSTILRELRRADVVHVRCPANIPLIACFALTFRRSPRGRWIKYAGNWRPGGREAISYTLQRWWLRRGFAGGRVTVNGRWPDQPGHVRSFLNPCLTAEEFSEGARIAAAKQIDRPLRLLFVGALNRPKGVGRVLDIFARLRRSGLDAELELVGDGPERPAFERRAAELGIIDRITFHGWLPRPDLGPIYGRAHIFLFPTTSSEGWPKVLSEAMAYGAVPVAGAISSIPQILEATGAGIAVEPDNLDGFASAILGLADDPDRWSAMSRAGVAAAPGFTYEAYLDSVRGLFREMGVDLPERSEAAGTMPSWTPAAP